MAHSKFLKTFTCIIPSFRSLAPTTASAKVFLVPWIPRPPYFIPCLTVNSKSPSTRCVSPAPCCRPSACKSKRFASHCAPQYVSLLEESLKALQGLQYAVELPPVEDCSLCGNGSKKPRSVSGRSVCKTAPQPRSPASDEMVTDIRRTAGQMGDA